MVRKGKVEKDYRCTTHKLDCIQKSAFTSIFNIPKNQFYIFVLNRALSTKYITEYFSTAQFDVRRNPVGRNNFHSTP